MSALAAMQDKNAHLENSLSAETRLKLDLFSALGEAKRQLEICQGVLSCLWSLLYCLFPAQTKNLTLKMKFKFMALYATLGSSSCSLPPSFTLPSLGAFVRR